MRVFLNRNCICTTLPTHHPIHFHFCYSELAWISKYFVFWFFFFLDFFRETKWNVLFCLFLFTDFIEKMQLVLHFFSIIVAYCDCIPCVIDICKYVAYFFPCSTYFFGTVLRWDMASSTHKFIRKVVEKKYTMYSKYL